MATLSSTMRQQARAIWQAAVDAVRADDLVRKAFADPNLGLHDALAAAQRILVVGAGKAGAARQRTKVASKIDPIFFMARSGRMITNGMRVATKRWGIVLTGSGECATDATFCAFAIARLKTRI